MMLTSSSRYSKIKALQSSNLFTTATSIRTAIDTIVRAVFIYSITGTSPNGQPLWSTTDSNNKAKVFSNDLRSQRNDVPVVLYPAEKAANINQAIIKRYHSQSITGSAVNSVLREGNSDHRVAVTVKAFATKHFSMMEPSTISMDNEAKQSDKKQNLISSGKSSVTNQQSASNTANENWGFNATMRHYRSILMHPIGIPMVNYLNDIEDNPEQPDYVRNALNNFLVENRDQVFVNAALAWQKGNEKDLTEQLLRYINMVGKQRNDVLLQHAEKEKKVTGSEGTGFLDLMFREQSNSNDSRKSIVAMFEFGFEDRNWWKKQDQLLIYASMIRKNLDKNYKLDQPILLSVVTIKKEDCNDFTEDTPIDDIHLGARFGVFLYVPKGDADEFRISLLWRAETANLRDTSCQFGKVLNAVKLCARLRKYCNSKANTINYEYLGPNCCRIGDKLYRAYDTRLRSSERRSDLYLQRNVFSNACEPIAKSVIKIDDHTCIKVQRDQIGSDIDWLWDYKGELRVISTTYYDGVHYATHPLHFVPVINHLESLHSQGFVHGDIRAYNMVLPREDTGAANANGENEDEGWLIDFDYGGKAKIVTYPKGYKPTLADGDRAGEAGKPITIMDDWQSLFGLILTKYRFFPRKEYRYDDPEYGTKLSMLRDQLEIYPERVMENEVSHLSPPALLREYLELVAIGYTIKPSPTFKKDMEKCGLWNNPSNTGKNASGAATGSQKKDEI